MRVAIGSALALLASGALAQTPFFGPRTYPQFRDMSGLSGAGVGVLPDGTPSLRGAISLSTPIGYVLGPSHWAFGAASRSVNGQFTFINFRAKARDDTFKSDGTGQIVAGFKTPIGNIAVSHMVLSTFLDNVQHVQWQLPLRTDKVGVSVGVHNLFDRGNAAGEDRPGDDDPSRSFFVAATTQLAPGAFLTIGKGDIRYKGVFGNASVNVTDRVKLYGEYDGFGWNSGIAIGFGPAPQLKLGDKPIRSRAPEVFLTAGYVQGRRATWTINFVF